MYNAMDPAKQKSIAEELDRTPNEVQQLQLVVRSCPWFGHLRLPSFLPVQIVCDFNPKQEKTKRLPQN